jgi:hypothetical protein
MSNRKGSTVVVVVGGRVVVVGALVVTVVAPGTVDVVARGLDEPSPPPHAATATVRITTRPLWRIRER